MKNEAEMPHWTSRGVTHKYIAEVFVLHVSGTLHLSSQAGFVFAPFQWDARFNWCTSSLVSADFESALPRIWEQHGYEDRLRPTERAFLIVVLKPNILLLFPNTDTVSLTWTSVREQYIPQSRTQSPGIKRQTQGRKERKKEWMNEKLNEWMNEWIKERIND